MKEIAVFASGGGSNFKSIQENIESGNISARIKLLVSNNVKSGAVKYAKEKKIDIFIINKIRFPDIEIGEDLLLEALKIKQIDLICLAGYMKLISKSIIKEFKDCILNIHPALLPNFGGKGFFGMNVHKAVIESGVKESGVTIHFVNEKYDEGQIIAQEKIAIRSKCTPNILAREILKIEHKLYPKIIKAFCEDRLFVHNNYLTEIKIEN